MRLNQERKTKMEGGQKLEQFCATCFRPVKLFRIGILFEIVVITFLAFTPTSQALSFMPEFLWYKTCADSPPGFSPGSFCNNGFFLVKS